MSIPLPSDQSGLTISRAARKVESYELVSELTMSTIQKQVDLHIEHP